MTTSTRRAPRALLLATALAAALAAPLAARAAITVTDLGSGAVTDMSADGNAAVGMEAGGGVYRWTASGGKQYLGRNPYKTLGVGGGTPAISADGNTVAATIVDTTGTVATEGRWTVADGWHQLAPPLPPDGGTVDGNDCGVFGMSRDGLVVTGLYWLPASYQAHGSVWQSSTGMVGLPTAGRSARIDDADLHGHVMAGWEENPTSGERMAAVWVDGVRTFLDGGGDVPGEATKVNADGTVIVGYSYDFDTNRDVAAMWRWDGAAWNRTLLGLLPGGGPFAASYALGLSDDGSVVVGLGRDKSFQQQSRGFIWTAATGIVDANRWLGSEGAHQLQNHFAVSEVSAVTPDGKVLMLVGASHKSVVTSTLRVEVVDGAPAAH